MKEYFPCICSHPRGNHAGDYVGGRCYCNKSSCDCRQYVSDNLNYLEKRYEESLKNGTK